MDSPEYATEELVAELGTAIGCARLGISPTPRADRSAIALGSHPAYLWPDYWNRTS